jgi:dTDP-4-dehydrorhamnose reductase
MNRNAVVFGASGQLGLELVRELERRRFSVAGWERAQVDITDSQAVERALAKSDPGVVFNAAAYNQVDVAEKEPQAALQVNGLAVRNLALACRQVDAQLVHFSTDYVFDGTAGGLTRRRSSPPSRRLRGFETGGRTVRASLLKTPPGSADIGVFGPGGCATARGNFVELMLRLAGSGQPIRVVEDHVASPTYAPLLAARSIDWSSVNKRAFFTAAAAPRFLGSTSPA